MQTRFIGFLLLFLAGCTSAKPPEPALSEAQRQLNVDSFDQVWTTIRDHHFDPNLNGVDWNAARAELRPKVEQATTMTAARAAMSDLLDRLHESHFAIIPATTYATINDAKAGARNGASGIDLRVIDGAAIVTRVDEHSTAADAGVKAGWELLSIAGQPVAPTISELSATYAVSTLKDAMLAHTLAAQLRGSVGQSLVLQFRDANDHSTSRNLILKAPLGEPVDFGNLPTFYVRFDSKILPPNVGYLAFNVFLGPQLARFRAAIESFMQTDGLIIDLRGNPGGIGLMAVGMGNLLIDQPNQKLGTMKTRQLTLNFVLDPQSITYQKPVAVIVDGCSMSTSEIFAQGLHDIHRAKIFGTRTAGAALPSTVELLPNGDGFQYAFAQYTSVGGAVLEGHGLTPDEVVSPSRAALLAGHDAPLDAAVRWIESQKK